MLQSDIYPVNSSVSVKKNHEGNNYLNTGFFEMKSWQPVSLPAWLNDLNIEVILISGFMNSEIRITSKIKVKLILISEITNSEIRICSTFRSFCQPGRLTGCQDFISKNL